MIARWTIGFTSLEIVRGQLFFDIAEGIGHRGSPRITGQAEAAEAAATQRSPTFRAAVRGLTRPT